MKKEKTDNKIEEHKKGLIKHELFLLQQFASGEEVVPDKIAPKLIEVHSGSKDELRKRSDQEDNRVLSNMRDV